MTPSLSPAPSSITVFPAALIAEAGHAPCAGCRNGIELDIEFEFAYQPIVDVATRTIFGHEALVRGPNGESAYSVLSQVNDQNRYKFDQACRVKAVAGAARLGLPGYLSINFLPNAVYRPDLCLRTTLAAAKEHDFPVERIIFEVTESEQVRDRKHLVNIFEEYRRFGFMTAIDDFGAGYAGLNLLSEYQPHIVKLDMDLVRDIDRHRPRQVIVSSMVAMCRDLGVRVLAEGVETRAERDFLRSAGIGLMQGYFFSKPVFQGGGTIDPALWD
ncbi:EAL domain-containing protein [Pseudoduganella sp. GCM10020061]|uniref:EAL domain-containing protein n=1 Tax=Pseudoduganella sp. GCM10020061 TaxID=3317345 RepID=UPI0036404194